MRIAALLFVVWASGRSAADGPWTDLLASDKLDVFTVKSKDWKWAKAVTLDPVNAKKLAFEPGPGILVNGEKGTAMDLYTKDQYGDLELHLEFLIAKGSNSGVKFHGHYEIQISDSYGKKDLTGDDCGGFAGQRVRG